MSDGQIYIDMKIPNEEIHYIYQTKIIEWTQERIKRTDLSALYAAMLTGSTDNFQKELEKQLHGSISYFDVKEAFYHGFVLGLLNPMENDIAMSNREAGDGRPDILIKSFHVKKPAVILELKHVNSFQEMHSAAESALVQINDSSYVRELERDGYEYIIKYGIALYKKNCYIVKESMQE